MELCRRHGISDATFYTWRAKYGGMAESMLDVATLREALGKNFYRQLPQGGGDLGKPREGLFAAARLCTDCHCTENLLLCHRARR
jgi:hypothetical protein